MKIMLQNMLPTIDVKTVRLSDCRRVVLFHYRKEDGLVELRHYAIRATPVGVSRSVKKIIQGKVPDLSSLEVAASSFICTNVLCFEIQLNLVRIDS